MRMIWYLLVLTSGGYGLWWLTDTQPIVKEKIETLIQLRSIRGLEVRYPMEQIMELHQKHLFKEKGTRLLESTLKFYPYLLLETKYLSKDKTKEGLLLWDLSDGELVLSTQDWVKTHGFRDCIQTHVLPNEFRILAALARKEGLCDRQYLLEKAEIDPTLAEMSLQSCSKKNLIVDIGEKFRLNLENPKLARVPETQVQGRLVTRTYKNATHLRREFSIGQIEKMAKVAFGPQFSIRRSTEVYLPVYCLIVQLSDGTHQTHHINALTGKVFASPLLYE